ncbi:hypothetical protein O0L34_g13822 [Tuta absoluta]|nr:hypothetical protein O0L34_g13822 [Tuta absoluta]
MCNVSCASGSSTTPGAVGQAPAHSMDASMRNFISLLLLWACTAMCEPLKTTIQRRSDRPGIYASDYARGYRPYVYMALPLHSPMPVLHVLSSAPLHRPNRGLIRHLEPPRIYASSMSHSWYAPPPTRDPVLLSPYSYPPQPTSDPLVLSPVESAPAPEILYARPKPGGGYEYSKKPLKRRRPAKPKEPMIIRIHKYRVIRD